MISELIHHVASQWLSLTVSLISAAVYFIVSSKDRRGFLLGLVNQGFWLAFMVYTAQWGLIISISLFVYVNIRGWILWGKYPPKKCKCQCIHDREPVNR